MPALETAPLWLCFLPQLVSVAGDSFGQRCVRVYHKMSRRRFLLGMCAVTCLQMFFFLSIIQLAAPKMTTIIYTEVNGTTVDYCSLPENEGAEECYPQGPLTIYKALYICPLLLVDGLVNMGYYLGEAALYQESLGVLMLVLAALSSSFIINPLQHLLGASHGQSGIPVGALILGIIGSVICLIERTPPAAKEAEQEEEEKQAIAAEEEATVGAARDDEDAAGRNGSLQGGSSLGKASPAAMSSASLASDYGAVSGKGATSIPPPGPDASCGEKTKYYAKKAKSYLPLLAPFSLLAIVYAMYFVMMLVFNDKCKSNMWGYNALDQVLLPCYLIPMFMGFELLPDGAKKVVMTDLDREESFKEAVIGTWHELWDNKGLGFWHLFIYRFLINGRAIAYSYIAVRYNLSSSYLQLTLIRVVLSWIASLGLVLVVPRFILAEKAEQIKLKDKVNIALKMVGTVVIVGSLLLLHKSALE